MAARTRIVGLPEQVVECCQNAQYTPEMEASGPKNPPYLPRVVDVELDELFRFLPAIALEGARGVGKTATARRRARTIHYLDNPDTAIAVAGQPSLLVTGQSPILVDEWQRFQESWDLVRRAVDDDRTPGRFLLTGSANRSDAPAHSGAGRIVRLRLRPMTLGERGIETPTVSLAELLSGTRPMIDGSTKVNLEGYVAAIVSSGFPGLRGYGDRALHNFSSRFCNAATTPLRNAKRCDPIAL